MTHVDGEQLPKRPTLGILGGPLCGLMLYSVCTLGGPPFAVEVSLQIGHTLTIARSQGRGFLARLNE